MRASELVILRCAVVPFKQKILAEHEPLTRASRAGDKFSNHWGRDNAYKDLHAGHRSLGPELFFEVSAGAIGSHPRSSVRKEPDCAQAGRFSRRLQLAPGLVPPTSWSPPRCIGPRSSHALNR